MITSSRSVTIIFIKINQREVQGSDTENTELDRGRHMPNNQPSVIAETGEGPRIGRAPLRGVDAVLVLHPNRDDPVIQLSFLSIFIHQRSVRLAGEGGDGGENDFAVAAGRQDELVMVGVVPHTPDPVTVLSP